MAIDNNFYFNGHLKGKIGLFEQFSGYYNFLNFGSSLVDLGDFGIAHEAFYMVFFYITIASMYLHGLYGYVHGHFGSIQFGHGTLRTKILFLVF